MAVRCVGPKSCLSVWEEDLSAHGRLSDAVCFNGVCGGGKEREKNDCVGGSKTHSCHLQRSCSA